MAASTNASQACMDAADAPKADGRQRWAYSGTTLEITTSQ
jgi:hypothetical protein